MIKIITDSSCDLPIDKANEKNITIVPLTVIIDGVEYQDQYTLNAKEFYEKLPQCASLPTTSQPSPEAFYKHIEEAKLNNDEVIIIVLSSKLSGTYQSAMIAKEMSEYNRVYIIDSLQTTIGLQFLVNEAFNLRQQGLNAREIVEQIEKLKNKVKMIAVVDTLDYLVKGGRLSKTSAIAGTLLKIKPIITLNNGVLEVMGKSRGLTKATSTIASIIEKNGGMDLNYPVYIGYTGNTEGNEKFEEIIKMQHTFNHCQTYIVGSCIGTHAGPGAKVIAYKQK